MKSQFPRQSPHLLPVRAIGSPSQRGARFRSAASAGLAVGFRDSLRQFALRSLAHQLLQSPGFMAEHAVSPSGAGGGLAPGGGAPWAAALVGGDRARFPGNCPRRSGVAARPYRRPPVAALYLARPQNPILPDQVTGPRHPKGAVSAGRRDMAARTAGVRGCV